MVESSSERKRCSKCGEHKPHSEYYAHPRGASGLQPSCKTCCARRAREYRAAHPEVQRAQKARYRAVNPQRVRDGVNAWRRVNRDRVNAGRRRRRMLWEYGLEPFVYAIVFAAQDARCAICLERPDRLVVDHCHATGTLRGLLCNECNSALGFLGDSPEALERAARYLEGDSGYNGS